MQLEDRLPPGQIWGLAMASASPGEAPALGTSDAGGLSQSGYLALTPPRANSAHEQVVVHGYDYGDPAGNPIGTELGAAGTGDDNSLADLASQRRQGASSVSVSAPVALNAASASAVLGNGTTVSAPSAARPIATFTPPAGGSSNEATSSQIIAAGLMTHGNQGHDGDINSQGGGGGSYIVGPDVPVNSRDRCPGGSGTLQSETAVAVSGNAVVVTYNDFRGFYCSNNGYQVTGWGYSLDGGQTFTDGGPLPGRTALGGDGELAVGPDGTIYLASLWQPLSGMAVLRGTVTDSGISWSNPTVIMTPGEAYDKENIAVDQNTGTIYLTYTRFGQTPGIGMYVSNDGGLTFQGPITVVRQSGVQGSFPAVGPNGELYVAYNIGYPNDTGVGFVASYDGGQTFTDPQQIEPTTHFTVPGSDRSPSFPSLAVDDSGGPNTGNLYLAWQSSINGQGEAVYSASYDGGSTWTDPQPINNDGGTGLEWAPTISVDANGNLNAFFYSRRANPGTNLTDLYYAQSQDGGNSFGQAFAVTDMESNWRTSSDGSPTWGDYMNSVSVGSTAVVAYADGRAGDPDAYFNSVTSGF